MSTQSPPQAQKQTPHVTSVTPLPHDEARWISFQKVSWVDQSGVPRIWETVSRKTRGKSGIDAVAIMPILRYLASSPKSPSTIIILQYRPPVDAICVEFPAGLIDRDEAPEVAALRELREETGYEGRVTGMSPVVVSNPGMSTGNMCLCTVEVNVKEGQEKPKQMLEEGEFIELLEVPLGELYQVLERLSAEGKKVDSRLWHTAAGLELGKSLGKTLS